MEEVLLDWNELAEQYGKFPFSLIVRVMLTIDGCFLFSFFGESCYQIICSEVDIV